MNARALAFAVLLFACGSGDEPGFRPTLAALGDDERVAGRERRGERFAGRDGDDRDEGSGRDDEDDLDRDGDARHHDDDDGSDRDRGDDDGDDHGDDDDDGDDDDAADDGDDDRCEDRLPPNLAPLPDALVANIALTPADMSTATFNTVPTLSLPVRGLSEADVAVIAARFELVTWPEREVVPTTPVYLDEAIEPAVSSRIVFQPDAPLAERWYVLRGVPPVGQNAPDPKDSPVDIDGKSVSRFFVGRLPGIQRVLVGARAEGGGDIEIFYSERVRAHAAHAHIEVTVDGDVAHCRVGNRCELRSTDGAPMVWLECDLIAPGSTVRVTHRRPMESIVGEPVTAPDGSELSPIEVVVPLSAAAARAASTTAESGPTALGIHVPSFGLGTPSI